MVVIRSAARPVGARPGLAEFCLQPDDFGAGEQGVADDREPVERQPAVEQVGLDPLGDQRRLPDRHVADQCRVRQRRRRARSPRAHSWASSAQPQPVTEDRLVHGGRAGGQRHRRRPVEDLADRQVVEVGAALTWPYEVTAPCWQAWTVSTVSDMAVHEHELNDEETMLVETVRAFVDRDVKPTVREVEHANDYPEAWIEQMKRIGIYGLAIPEEYGGSPVSMPCYVLVTQELARGWMSLAGAMGGHTVVAKLLDAVRHRGAEADVPAADGDRRAAGHDGADRARRRLGSAEHDDRPRVADGDDLVINGAKTWISNARRSGLIALLCKTDPAATPKHTGHLGACSSSTGRG